MDKEIRERLAGWLSEKVVPPLARALKEEELPATAKQNGDKVFIEYEALAMGTGYIRPTVVLEFGARSTGEPSEIRNVICDAAEHLREVQFPTATPRVMRAERTFWEKATAIHVFCAQGAFRGGDRFARHWHDVTRLDAAGFADAAIADRPLGKAVADHKSMFFAENDTDGKAIDYHAAVSGALRLVPESKALTTLAEDYRQMIEDGLLLDDAEPFEDLLALCQAIQDKANANRTTND